MRRLDGEPVDRLVWNIDSEARKEAWRRECEAADGKHRTNAQYTQTSEGRIPHLGKGDMRYPVKLVRLKAMKGGHTLLTNLDGIPTPERDSWGQLVFAYPGDR